jgi:hypothetical protein
LGYYAALIGITFPDVSGQRIVPIFKGQETIHYSLRNDPEDHWSYLLCNRTLKSSYLIQIWGDYVYYILQCLQSELPQRTVFLIDPFHRKRYMDL